MTADERLTAARESLREAIADTLRLGRRDPTLAGAMHEYVAAREAQGVPLSKAEAIAIVARLIMEAERELVATRDPFARDRGAEDPVVSIADCCIQECSARDAA